MHEGSPTSTDAGESGRTLGLAGATGVGLGAIIGGGILVLAGLAFAATGPSAALAFLLNGVIAFLTALSFVEMATRYPQSGGAYTYAKTVGSVRIAFSAGWLLAFAYVVAAALYALGFAVFLVPLLEVAWPAAGAGWLGGVLPGALAVGATGAFSLALLSGRAGGGQAVTVGKVILFVLIIAAGLVVLPSTSLEHVGASLTPFFTHGAAGLAGAMGLTFIALQGFDAIATVAGEVREPRRVLPRAILGSLAIALAIYIPLLLLVSVLGVNEGGSIATLASEDPETVIAVAVANFLGPTGWWIVMVAAVLSMLSALEANLRAASQVVLSMGRDRTLPREFGRVDESGTPGAALRATALCVVVIVLAVSDLATASAAAGLVFLLLFASTHLTAYLVRRRVGRSEAAFHAPLFPAVQILGGTACLGLATFQFFASAGAAKVLLVWVALGLVLYRALLARRAQAADAGQQARDPSLVASRGHSPLVLVPVANPQRSQALIDLAEAIAPPRVGRVLLLTVVVGADRVADDEVALAQLIGRSQDAVGRALASSFAQGRSPEAIVSFAAEPWSEIARIAREHRCESVVTGLTASDESSERLEGLVGQLQGDALVLRAGPEWRLSAVKRVLIPIGGRGGLDSLRARLLGSLARLGQRHVTFLRVLAFDAPESARAGALRQLRELAEDEAPGADLEVVCSDDPQGAVIGYAAQADLLILGTRRTSGQRAFGDFALAVAEQAPCATVLISRGGAAVYSPASSGRNR